MTLFLGDARRQVEEILKYVSALGAVALVDLLHETVELSMNVDGSENFLASACASHREQHPVVMVDDRTVVGSVGHAHSLVLRGALPFAAHAVALARVTKACALLNRMLPPIDPETPRGPAGASGAASLLAITLPPTRPGKPPGFVC